MRNFEHLCAFGSVYASFDGFMRVWRRLCAFGKIYAYLEPFIRFSDGNMPDWCTRD